MISRLMTVAALALVLGGLTACGSDDSDAAGGGTPPSGPCQYVSDGSGANVDVPDSEPTATGDVPATLAMSTGDVALTLHADAAPCTVNSFVSLATQGYFDNSSCHRLTTAGIFVLQCGDPTGTGSGGPGYSFADELDSTDALADGEPWDGTKTKVYPAGTVAMANAGADTNGSQFFLVYADSTLPPAYTVFGTMSADGLAAVKKVAADGEDDSNGAGDGHPNDDVIITGVTVS